MLIGMVLMHTFIIVISKIEFIIWIPGSWLSRFRCVHILIIFIVIIIIIAIVIFLVTKQKSLFNSIQNQNQNIDITYSSSFFVAEITLASSSRVKVT